MPIYEYQCENCDEVFEISQKISDPPPSRHHCGSTRIKRLLSSTSFVLKGGGWYADGYASAKPGNFIAGADLEEMRALLASPDAARGAREASVLGHRVFSADRGEGGAALRNLVERLAAASDGDHGVPAAAPPQHDRSCRLRTGSVS